MEHSTYAYLKPFVRIVQKRAEFFHRPLLCSQLHQHSNIKLTEAILFEPRSCARRRQHNVVDQERRAWPAFLQCWNKGLKNPDTIAVVPVVETLTDEKYICIADGLGLEEIVLHERDSALQIIRALFLTLTQHYGGTILYHKTEFGKHLSRKNRVSQHASPFTLLILRTKGC